jgi:hypothetical protein
MLVSIPRIVKLLREKHNGVAPPESLAILDKFNKPHPVLGPEDHLACIDVTYWFLEQPDRFDLHQEWLSGEGVWNRVGRHIRFAPGLYQLADQFLRYELGLGTSESIPPVSLTIQLDSIPDRLMKRTVYGCSHTSRRQVKPHSESSQWV